jgi:hypothetical protein
MAREFSWKVTRVESERERRAKPGFVRVGVDEDNGSDDLDGLAGEVEEGPELMQNSNERSRRREG